MSLAFAGLRAALLGDSSNTIVVIIIFTKQHNRVVYCC
jgi:hypothetical protein